MKHILGVVLVFLFLLFNSVNAQEDSNSDCNIDSLKSRFAEEIQNATTLEELNEIHTTLGTTIYNCISQLEASAVYSFDGTGDTTLGPFELDPGIYLVDYSASALPSYANFKLQFEHESDYFMTWHSDSGDLAGHELVKLSGGTYYANVISSNTWSFSVTPLDTASKIETLALSSEGVTDFIGPFDLEPGFYTVQYEGTVDPADPIVGPAHFYLHLNSADNLMLVKGESETSDSDFSSEKIYSLEGGSYIITVQQDGLTSWAVKLIATKQ